MKLGNLKTWRFWNSETGKLCNSETHKFINSVNQKLRGNKIRNKHQFLFLLFWYQEILVSPECLYLFVPFVPFINLIYFLNKFRLSKRTKAYSCECAICLKCAFLNLVIFSWIYFLLAECQVIYFVQPAAIYSPFPGLRAWKLSTVKLLDLNLYPIGPQNS